MLSKAPSRRCSLQCWTVFICYCEVAAMKIRSYPYKTKEKEISSQTLLCFPLQFHCAYGIPRQPSLIDMLSLFLLPWLGITPWRKLFFIEDTVQWHCSAQLQYHVQVTTLYELLWPEFIPVHSKECGCDRLPFGDPLTWTRLPNDVSQLNILIRCNGFQAWMFPAILIQTLKLIKCKQGWTESS